MAGTVELAEPVLAALQREKKLGSFREIGQFFQENRERQKLTRRALAERIILGNRQQSTREEPLERIARKIRRMQRKIERIEDGDGARAVRPQALFRIAIALGFRLSLVAEPLQLPRE